MNKTHWIVAALLMCAGIAPVPASAQNYPSRAIHLVVPFAPGGPTDELARALASTLSSSLGQAVVVENRVGAGGGVGMDFVARSAPDGYTLGMGHTGSNSINPALYPKLPYDPAKDFAPITPVVSYSNLLVCNPKVPARNVAELVAWAKAHPQAANFASGGIGATNHLSIEILKSVSGAPLQHVPYKGNAPAMLDVKSGGDACMFDILITAMPQIQAGKVRPIAITSRSRSPYLPDVPTMGEAGLPAYDAAGNDLWFGLFAPAKTPSAIVDKLNAAVIAAIQTPELQKVVRGMYYEPWTLTPTAFSAFLQTDREKWSKVVRDSGAKAE